VGLGVSSAPRLPPSQLAGVISRVSASSPPIEDATLRAQVAYNVAYTKSTMAFEGTQRAQSRRLEEILGSIEVLASGGGGGLGSSGGGGGGSSSGSMVGASRGGNPLLGAATPSTVSALNDVYRLLLDFCTTFTALDAGVSGRKPAPGSLSPSPAGGPLSFPEFSAASIREQAAALDSVFPRSAIPAFTTLDAPTRAVQAVELARLSLGVRLYNWETGKGGLGLENTPMRGLEEARGLGRELLQGMRGCMAACDGYVDVFSVAGGYGGGVGGVEGGEESARMAPILAAMAAAFPPTSSSSGGVASGEVSWPSELVNRRQMALFASSLASEVERHTAVLEMGSSAAANAVGELRRLLQGRGGAARKEDVYPLFETLGEAWLACAEARCGVACAREVWDGIAPYTPPSLCTLPEGVKQVAQSMLSIKGRATSASSLPVMAPPMGGAGGAAPSVVALADINPATASIECGGFCPVSIVSPVPRLGGGNRRATTATTTTTTGAVFQGAVIHGDATLGYVSWEGRLYSCASPAAMEAFMGNPGYFVGEVGRLALLHPSLVFLLQLFVPARSGHFPDLNLPLLARFDGDLGAVAGAVAAEGGALGGDFGAQSAAPPLPLPPPLPG
jgi:hypothetical protein